jgi:peptidoglycan/LPS O-acetylase OafA/YrhL
MQENLQSHLNSRNNNLWLIRLIAAIMVIYGHCYPLANTLQKNSHIADPLSRMVLEYLGFHKGMAGQAVCIFFFVSGLLIAKSCATQNWWRFWTARILRIYPALWVNIIFCALLGLMVGTLGASEFLFHPETKIFVLFNSTLWQAVVTLPNVFAELPWNTVNGSLWTLPHEIRMYIYCFIVGVVGILRLKWLFNIMMIALIACYLTLNAIPYISDSGTVNLPLYFMLGMFAYVNAAHIPLKCWILAALMVALIPIYMIAPRVCYDLAFAIALAYAILFLAYKKHWRSLDFSHVGDFSYGIYLYGYPIQQLIIWAHEGAINPLWLFVLSMATLAPIACASWFLVERPALNLHKKLSKN